MHLMIDVCVLVIHTGQYKFAGFAINAQASNFECISFAVPYGGPTKSPRTSI